MVNYAGEGGVNSPPSGLAQGGGPRNLDPFLPCREAVKARGQVKSVPRRVTPDGRGRITTE